MTKEYQINTKAPLETALKCYLASACFPSSKQFSVPVVLCGELLRRTLSKHLAVTHCDRELKETTQKPLDNSDHTLLTQECVQGSLHHINDEVNAPWKK